MEVNINKKNSGIIIAGMNSSDGKTFVTCLLLSALVKRGISVQPFKIGPDYIDPGYHSHFSLRHSLNIDPWIMGKELVISETKKFTENAFGLAEGVMGLFDGSEKQTDVGSSMEVSRWLNWQILLVVPCKNAGRSITAAIKGYVSEAGGIKHFAGIILNKVNSASHGEYLLKACAPLNIPLIGSLTEESKFFWPERHLGLQPMLERKCVDREDLADFAEENIKIDFLLNKFSLKSGSRFVSKSKNRIRSNYPKRIAVAQDEAFHFYYAANLSWLKEQGLEIVLFSPLHDLQVPKDTDAIILGGGFPEVFAEKISLNKNMIESLRKSIESGMPCYAECGGMMILAEGLKLCSGELFSMAGVVPGIIEMTKQLQHFGYCKINLPGFGEIRGHEFHYSTWSKEEEMANLWSVTRHSTGVSRNEGYRVSKLHASYVHLYFPQVASLICDFFGLPFKEFSQC